MKLLETMGYVIGLTRIRMNVLIGKMKVSLARRKEILHMNVIYVMLAKLLVGTERTSLRHSGGDSADEKYKSIVKHF